MFKRQHLQFICISGLMLLFTLLLPLSLWAETGNEKWNVQRGSRMDSSPAIRGDGRVYIGSDDDRLYAFDHAPEGKVGGHNIALRRCRRWRSPSHQKYYDHQGSNTHR